MICFDCSVQKSKRTDAIGVCHHCGVAVCNDHGVVVADPVHVHELVAKEISLPKKARELLCRTCLDALRQREVLEVEEQSPATDGGGATR
jgi:hypothetical protein